MDEENGVVIVTNVFGDICIRKARRKRQKLLVKELLYDYANNTTLHGLPYVTRSGLTLIEKIFWLITFLASVILCLLLISKVWFKWQTSPVIVTVSEQLVPVYEVPFPSVTICPQSKCKVSIYNFTNEKMVVDAFLWQNNATINDTMRERIAKFGGISEVCGVPPEHNLSEIVYPNGYTDSSVVKNIIEVAPSYTDVFFRCYVHNKEVQCDELFDMVLTSEGICYNMNSLAAREIFRITKLQRDYQYLYTTKPRIGWTVEHGYSEPITNPKLYPAPGSENGETPDVEVVLKHSLVDRDRLCNGINSGFKVYIQHPTDLPQSSLYYYAVLNDQVSSMALSFNILNTSESLRSYDAEVFYTRVNQGVFADLMKHSKVVCLFKSGDSKEPNNYRRQCYFPDERYLKYFSLYTAANCRIECLSNITYKTCGCVAFHMPYSSSNRICTSEHDECMSNARRLMTTQEMGKNSFKCHCLPACNSMDYEAEILKTKYNLKQFINTYIKTMNDFDKAFKGIKLSKLEMYFKRPRFLSMRRSELYGLTDFLANCGGLLGLFLGFSFLSLVEIFYFLSLRLCCTLKKDLQEEKALNEPEKEIHVDKY